MRPSITGSYTSWARHYCVRCTTPKTPDVTVHPVPDRCAAVAVPVGAAIRHVTIPASGCGVRVAQGPGPGAGGGLGRWAVVTLLVDHQRPRSQFDEVGFAERVDDRVEVGLDQREEFGVGDVAGGDDQ